MRKKVQLCRYRAGSCGSLRPLNHVFSLPFGLTYIAIFKRLWRFPRWKGAYKLLILSDLIVIVCHSPRKGMWVWKDPSPWGSLSWKTVSLDSCQYRVPPPQVDLRNISELKPRGFYDLNGAEGDGRRGRSLEWWPSFRHRQLNVPNWRKDYRRRSRLRGSRWAVL